MKRVTFDSNCIFLLDEKGPKTTFVQQLINYHNQGKITIQVPLIMAYENRLGERHGMSLDRNRDGWRNLESDLKLKIKRHGFDPEYLERYAIVVEPELYPSEKLYVAGEETIALFKKVKDIIRVSRYFSTLLRISDATVSFRHPATRISAPSIGPVVNPNGILASVPEGS